MAAPTPGNEGDRLAQLRNFNVLDSLPEAEYDDLTFLASQICNTPIALISLIDENRQWFKSRIGLDAAETPRDLAFCAHAILKPEELLVVENAAADHRFRDNALVQNDPNIRFYAGAPLLTNSGDALGTLCVIDTEPRTITAQQGRALRALSRQAMALLALRRLVKEFEASLTERDAYACRLEEYQLRLERLNEALKKESGTDLLTSAANRRAFDQRLAEERDRAQRYNAPCSLALLDVDHFKAYNDSFGHQAGDEVLRSLVKVLQSSCRSVDTVARYGGEEFAVILPNTPSEEAFLLAERFRRAIELAEWPLRPVTVSVGVATTHPNEGVEDLIADADRALYKSKEDGRNRVSARSHPTQRAG